jgi:hypothetical protein
MDALDAIKFFDVEVAESRINFVYLIYENKLCNNSL